MKVVELEGEVLDPRQWKKPRITHINGEWYCGILCDSTDVAAGETPEDAFFKWKGQCHLQVLRRACRSGRERRERAMADYLDRVFAGKPETQ